MYLITRIIYDLQDGGTEVEHVTELKESVNKYRKQLLTKPNVKTVRLLYEEI